MGRYAPIYEERGDLAGLAGCVAFALGTVLALGVALIVLVAGFQGWLSGNVITNPQAIGILVVLIALAPATALDTILTALMAAFGKANAIFFRRHILNPGLKLAAIGLTVLSGGDVYFLAVSHMLAGVLGVLLYGALLSHLLKEHHLTGYFRPGKLRVDMRMLFRFSLPTLSSDLLNALRFTLVVVVMEMFHGLAGVAEYQAVLPISRLTYVVVESFALLFCRWRHVCTHKKMPQA